MPQRLQILVLDDERDAANLLSEVLTVFFPDAAVRVAYSGEHAVTAGTQNRPHVAIFDLEMTGMGGEAAAAALRAVHQSQVVFIALSGNTARLAALRQRAVFDHLLSKPVDIEALIDLVKIAQEGRGT